MLLKLVMLTSFCFFNEAARKCHIICVDPVKFLLGSSAREKSNTWPSCAMFL